MWRAFHAETAIKITDKFLAYYFVTILAYDREALAHVFLSQIRSADDALTWSYAVHQIDASKQMRWARRTLKLGCEYLPENTVLSDPNDGTTVHA